MKRDQFATLTAEELASLCEAAKGVTDRAIPDDHRKRLIYLNYIADRFGRLDLTEPGRTALDEVPEKLVADLAPFEFESSF